MDTGTRTTEELIELIRSGFDAPGGGVLDGKEGIEEMAQLLSEIAAPGFSTEMVSESGSREHSGVDGFREVLRDWITPYERFRLAVEELIVNGEVIVFLATQVATTKHGGVEVETPSASVWWLRDGSVSRIGFYLDRRAGLEAAGLDPDRA
jgi:ketosteroid isomerase-like protein